MYVVPAQSYQQHGNLYVAFVNVSDSFNFFSFLLINSLTVTNNAQRAIIVHVVSFELVFFGWFTKGFGLLKSGVSKVLCRTFWSFRDLNPYPCTDSLDTETSIITSRKLRSKCCQIFFLVKITSWGLLFDCTTQLIYYTVHFGNYLF